jgi:hypothetical protein
VLTQHGRQLLIMSFLVCLATRGEAHKVRTTDAASRILRRQAVRKGLLRAQACTAPL